MAKYSKIKFQYFEVCCFGENGKEELYDLKLWIEKISPLAYEERALTVRGNKCRLENFVKKEPFGFYGMRFMKLDELSNTYKIKEKAPAKHIDLDDDEYIGRSTVALYDPKLHVLMVQTSRTGVSAVGIESYINMTMGADEDGEKICHLRPILNPLDTESLGKRGIMKLDVRFANVLGFKASKDSTLERIIAGFREMSGITAHIEVGLGRTKNNSMDSETVSGMIKDIKDNEEHISSAKIKLTDDQKSNIYDLFDNILHNFIDFRIESRKEIDFYTMVDKMTEKYKEGTRHFIMYKDKRKG